MVISDAEKALDKIHHSLITKTLRKPGRGTSSTDKGHQQQQKSNIILNGERLNAFPLVLGTSQRCPLSPLLFNMVLESQSV